MYVSDRTDKLEEAIKGSSASFRTEVLSGKPAARIAQYVEDNEIGLVMMMSHGKSGIAPWSLGSTVKNVVYKLKVPIIVIRAREQEKSGAEIFSRILVPLDGSARGEVSLPYVKEITQRLASEVTLLRVIETGRHVHSVGGLEYVRFMDLETGSIKQGAQKYLDEVSAKLSGTKAKVRCELRSGESAREIIRFADEVDSSLIVMAAHGHSGIEAWMFGSVTSKILEASNRSVLLVPALPD